MNVTLSKTMSASVSAAFSACHPGVPSPVSRASLRVWAPIGTVRAPTSNTRVALRARSMTWADSGVGTKWPPAVRVPSERARSSAAPSRWPVAMPRR